MYKHHQHNSLSPQNKPVTCCWYVPFISYNINTLHNTTGSCSGACMGSRTLYKMLSLNLLFQTESLGHECLKNKDEFWRLTSTPSRISSTSIWNFVSLPDCLAWFLHLPPFENNNPSSLSTSLQGKTEFQQVKQKEFRKTNIQSWNSPSVSASFHCT